jgi:hypothetical protein
VRVGIVGGTGDIGEGMALRISQVHEVILGSREAERAGTASEPCRFTLDGKGLPCTISGVSNQEAVDRAGLVILAIPFQHVQGTLAGLTGLAGKVVVSPVNPLARKEAFLFTPPPEGSPTRRPQDKGPGTLRMQEALRYVLSLQVSTVIVGCDSVAQVEENVRFAREFNPLSGAQMAALEEKAKPVFQQALFFRRWT